MIFVSEGMRHSQYSLERTLPMFLKMDMYVRGRSSRVSDRTLVMCTPMRRCVPEHWGVSNKQGMEGSAAYYVVEK